MGGRRKGEEGGNTGTSHELNRTANSSTREGGGGGGGLGWGGGGCLERGREGRGGGDRSLLHYATHTYTHKKNGTQVAFPVRVGVEGDHLACLL